MTGKATTVFLAAIFASQVALPAVSFAGGKKGTSSSTVINFKAKLAPPPATPVAADVSGECEGEAKYKMKTTTITPPPALPSTSTEETFTGEVECPVLDLAVAPTDVYDMHLLRAGADYAVCSLVIKEIEFEYNKANPMVPAGMEGEYAVNVSQKTVPPSLPTLKQKIGGCTDAGLVNQLVPAVQLGDTATVFLHPDTLTPLLTGTFVASFGD